MKTLIPEPPLQLLPTLATWVGLEEALFLQQLHYWSQNYRVGKTVDGRKWVFNSLEEWQAENFPFWSVNTLRRIISNLAKDGLIDWRDDLNDNPQDRTRWYAIDYTAMDELDGPVKRVAAKKRRQKSSAKSARKGAMSETQRLGAMSETQRLQTAEAMSETQRLPSIYTETTLTETTLSDSSESEQTGSDFEENSERPEEDATMRNGGGDDDMKPITEPYGIFQRLYEIDPSIAGKRGQTLRDAKAMLNGDPGRCIAQFAPEDILGCAAFIVQDPWRKANMLSLSSQVIIEKLPKWIAEGRPSSWAEWQRKSKTNGSNSSVSSVLAEVLRDKTGDPELENEPVFG